MSESTLALVISAGILIVLALFVPCIDSLAGMLRRVTNKSNDLPEAQQRVSPYKRDAA
jgi:hypothetical protein